jgi:Protein of unknown function (DUF2958)
MSSSLLTGDMFLALVTNGLRSMRDDHFDPVPVVKLFTPDAGCTWLLTELNPMNPDQAFGLCDLGLGCPELGYVSLTELASVRGRLGLPVERDQHFQAKKSISAYEAEARSTGRILA